VTRGTAVTLVARLVLVALSAILTVVTSRGLGVIGRAVYAETSNAILLASALPSTGLGVANAYFAAGRSQRGALVANSVVISLATIGLGAVVLYVGQATAMIPQDSSSASAILIGVPLFTAAALLNSILLGSNRIFRYNVATVLQPLVLISLYASLLALGRFDAGTAVLGLVASEVPVVVLTFRWSLLGSERAGLRPAAALFRRGIAYAGAAQVAGLLVLANSRIGLYIVDPLAGRAEVGVLSVALVIADALSNLPQSLTVPLFAESARLAANDVTSATRAGLVSRIGLLVVAALSVPLVIAVALASPFVFGPEFQGLPIAVMLLLPAMIGVAPRLTSWTYLHSVGHPELVVAPAATGVLLNVLLELVLVPRLGANGACVALSASTLAMAYWILRRHAALSRVAMRDLLMPRRADVEFALAGARSLVRRTTA
jgi:O-antigen/teichoic acid export membrane protein